MDNGPPCKAARTCGAPTPSLNRTCALADTSTLVTTRARVPGFIDLPRMRASCDGVCDASRRRARRPSFDGPRTRFTHAHERACVDGEGLTDDCGQLRAV